MALKSAPQILNRRDMRDLERLNAEWARRRPEEIIRWAVETFWPAIAVSSSFQTQSLPLLHMVAQVAPALPVLFLDTGYHFAETLAFRDHLVRSWGLNLRVLRGAMPREEFQRRHGDDLHRRNPELCCALNKIEPMERALKGLRAWISGIRRDQTPARATIRVVEPTHEGITRIHPLAHWTENDIWQYIEEHNLPLHPLNGRGYSSIGCAPCTRPVGEGEERRAGRWAGQAKKECGLHTSLRAARETEPPGTGFFLRREHRKSQREASRCLPAKTFRPEGSE